MISCLLLIIGGSVTYIHLNQEKPIIKEQRVTPYLKTGSSELLNDIYVRLDKAYQSKLLNDECQLAAAYFAVDYFTLKGKEDNQVGGLDYIYPKLEVEDYEIISFSPSKVVIEGLEDNEYYNVLISLEFNREVEGLSNSANIVLVLDNDRFYVVGVDNA